MRDKSPVTRGVFPVFVTWARSSLWIKLAIELNQREAFLSLARIRERPNTVYFDMEVILVEVCRTVHGWQKTLVCLLWFLRTD